MKKTRIVILTSWGGISAIPILYALFKSNFEIVHIFSQGIHWNRIKKFPPPFYLNYQDNVASMIFKENRQNIFTIKSTANDKEMIDFIISNKIDYIFTIGYGEILKGDILNASRKGIVNFHLGLLPENRGGDPIASVILNHLPKTGISIHYVNEGIDTGDIILRKEIEVSPVERYRVLCVKLGLLAAEIVPELENVLFQGTNIPFQQEVSKVKYYQKPKIHDHVFDFTMKAEQIARIIRVFYSSPEKAFFLFRGYKVTVDYCEIFCSKKTKKEPSEIIDQGLDYIIVQTADEIVLLENLGVMDYSKEVSIQLINYLFDGQKKIE